MKVINTLGSALKVGDVILAYDQDGYVSPCEISEMLDAGPLHNEDGWLVSFKNNKSLPIVIRAFDTKQKVEK